MDDGMWEAALRHDRDLDMCIELCLPQRPYRPHLQWQLVFCLWFFFLAVFFLLLLLLPKLTHSAAKGSFHRLSQALHCSNCCCSTAGCRLSALVVVVANIMTIDLQWKAIAWRRSIYNKWPHWLPGQPLHWPWITLYAPILSVFLSKYPYMGWGVYRLRKQICEKREEQIEVI